jgi:glutathione S-transferase
MNQLTLVLANKNYSSWSVRPYILLKQAGIPFDEIVVPLDRPDTRARLLEHSPAAKAPILKDGAITVWESLAICEYAAERFPERQLWPADRARRVHARSIANEMHAGFMPMRQTLQMNCRARFPLPALADDVKDNIARIAAIWADCRARYGKTGDAGFLFGAFTIADAMYVPVVSRFVTWGVALEGAAKTYLDTVRALPAYRAWEAEAAAEPWRIEKYER